MIQTSGVPPPVITLSLAAHLRGRIVARPRGDKGHAPFSPPFPSGGGADPARSSGRRPAGRRPDAEALAPTPEALALARTLLTKMNGDPAVTIHQISGPMVGMLQQMGISDPTRARVIVQEALIPLLSSHYDELIEIMAKAYAATLSTDDMKAAVAFYESPAGQNLVAAEPKLAQAKLIGLTQWMSGLQPEMQEKIEEVIKAHGWEQN
ncbi:MAG TPA: DUF2059 domain-containing protein [Acetobacteraceae bacterium]|nr:DUF2059 domain-containing protein [Acetobacteraceae bacterium]